MTLFPLHSGTPLTFGMSLAIMAVMFATYMTSTEKGKRGQTQNIKISDIRRAKRYLSIHIDESLILAFCKPVSPYFPISTNVNMKGLTYMALF